MRLNEGQGATRHIMKSADETASAAHTYVCTSCGKQVTGRYLVGGWWQYPMGWFVHDDGERWVCGLVCARAVSGDANRSGERAKIDVDDD